MSCTRIFNNIKYLQLANENQLKSKSLEDNVYFTLRDIFNNVSGFDNCMEANSFNDALTNRISYQERTNDFTYTNVLNDKKYMYRLSEWLSRIHKGEFEFEALNDTEEKEKVWYYDTIHLFPFDDWWLQLEELKILIRERYKILIIC
jgi:hypothetical protein